MMQTLRLIRLDSFRTEATNPPVFNASGLSITSNSREHLNRFGCNFTVNQIEKTPWQLDDNVETRELDFNASFLTLSK